MSAPQHVAVPKHAHVPGMETYREKAARKFKQNPWVPIGSMVTVGALVVAMVKMRRGQSQSFNHWLRVRVAAQGLTIVALVVGTYSMRPKDENQGNDPTLTRNDADVERRRLEKIAREKTEFEERLKGAEEAHDMEASLRAGRKVQPLGVASVNAVKDNLASSGSGSTKIEGSWLGWLGWGRSSGSKSTGTTPTILPSSTAESTSSESKNKT